LAETGAIRYTMPEEGELVGYHERRLDSLGLLETAQRVEFWQGDACNLKDIFSGFDLILAANLIDRLYAPRRFLDTVADRLNSGGLLVLASPYTWLEEYTKRSGVDWWVQEGWRIPHHSGRSQGNPRPKVRHGRSPPLGSLRHPRDATQASTHPE